MTLTQNNGTNAVDPSQTRRDPTFIFWWVGGMVEMVMMIMIVMFIMVRFHFQSVYFKSSATEILLCFAQILKEHLVTIQNV